MNGGRWDVLVIGAGPAGSSAAWAAASRGARVLVIDRKRAPGEPVQCGEWVPRLIRRYVPVPPEAVALPVDGLRTWWWQGGDRVVVVQVESREEGEEKARRLLDVGIPAFVEEGTEEGSHSVSVMAHDAARAAAVLGLQQIVEARPVDVWRSIEGVGAPKPRGESMDREIFGVPRRQFWRYVIYYLAALVVVSVGAFVVTVWLLGGFSGEPSLSEIRSQLTAD